MSLTKERDNTYFLPGEEERRRKTLKSIVSIRNSDIQKHFNLRELIGESPFEDQSNIELRFNRFLGENGMAGEQTVIKSVVRDIAYAEVQGKRVWDMSYTEAKIEDAMRLVKTGAIKKLDAFKENEFKLAIAKKLFS